MVVKSRTRHTLKFMRTAAAHKRTDAADLFLALLLAFVAGATNAGGFLAVGQYTSHMTGIVSAIADNMALGALGVAGFGLLALVAFIAGAGCSAILINWGRRHNQPRQYAYPIALEALLLLGFGVLGTLASRSPQFIPLAIPLLCFIMGLQNATITKLSGARMRTTHVTGMVTDIGIELGKLVYWNRDATIHQSLNVRPDGKKLTNLAQLLGMFFVGGVTGAVGFGYFGYVFSVPLALLLLAISVPQLLKAALTH
jgi:uncharacterized membrane protein YoaK (UPF0700 family)